MTPGPTSVPPQVLEALAAPVTHHRTPEFRAMLDSMQQDLRWIFQTQQEVYIITASGTAGLEAALVTVLAPGSKVLSIDSGRFGRRWGTMARTFGMQVTVARFEAGTHVTPQAMSRLLSGAAFDAVLITHSETSTGTACDLAAIARAIRAARPQTLVMTDAITSIGAMPFHMDEWGIDAAVTGCQKALMVPPGLSYVALSGRAWDQAQANRQAQAFYLDLRRYRAAASKSDTPFTPAIPLVKAQAVALSLLRAQGLEQIWRRTHKHAEMVRRGMRAMGLELLGAMPADSVTAIRYPAGVDDAFRRMLAAEHNIHVAGGQDELSGRIFRVNHMGYTDYEDALAVVESSGRVMARLGANVDQAQGAKAAKEMMAA